MSLMYCPVCESQTEINVTGASNHPKKEKRLFYKRTRTCQKCNNQFYTVEVEEKVLDEYEKLKSTVSDIYVQVKPFTTFAERKKTLSFNRK